MATPPYREMEEKTRVENKITIKEAAELTGYDASTLQRACKSGVLPAEKHGKIWLLNREDAVFFGSRHPYRDGITRSKPVTGEQIRMVLDAEPLQTIVPEDQGNGWSTAKVFSYEDLLEQYRRGFTAGWKAAHESESQQ